VSRPRRTRLAVFSRWFEYPGFEAEVRATASEFNLVALGTTARQILQKGTREPDAVIVGHFEVYSPMAVLLVRRRWPSALVVVARAHRSTADARRTVRAGAHSWFLQRPREPLRMVLPWAVNELRHLLTEGQQEPALYASEFEQDLTIAPQFEELRPMDYEVLAPWPGVTGT
jgi:hypothetical protein